MSEEFCPLIGGDCKKHGCKFYVQVFGHNPNTGEPVNKFDCTFALLPTLTIENSQQQRQTAAAIESFRNEVALGNENTANLIAATNLLDK